MGKEKNTIILGGLIFEGEFVGGKKNGKGKEYYSVEDIYEKFFENHN